MASNSKSTTLYPQSGYGYTLYCGFSEENLTQEQIGKNVTKINANGYLKANGTYWATSHVSSLVLYWHDNKENKDIEIARNDFAGFNSTSDSRSVSASFEISHKDDGTLSGYVWISFTKGNTGAVYAPASGSVGTDWTALTTIPRATKLTEQTGTIGKSLTINWTKATSSFKHTLTYSLGSIKDEVLGENLVDNFVWNIPDKLYQEVIDKPSEVGTLKLTTYDGNTQIGSTQEAKLTITADESECNSVIEEFSVRDENGTTKALTGDNSVLVLTKSTAFVSLVFSTRKYATVRSVTVNGQQISVSAGTTDNKGNTSYGVMTDIGVANTGTFTVTIVDSRGFPITKTTRNDIIDYVPLDVVVSFKRIAPTTGEVGLEFNGNYFNGSFGEESNNLEISYKYKKANETEYSNEFALIKDTDYKISGNTFYSGNGSSKTQIKLAPSFDYKSQYDMQLTIKDKLTALPVINVIITKGIPIMWWNGEKVTINGDLYLADEDGNNPINVKNLVGGGGYDSLPVGSIINFDGDEVPFGYEEVEPNYIVATISSARNTGRNVRIEMDTIAEQSGTKLSLTSGAIKIGEGVTKVRVSGSLFIDDWVGGSTYAWGKIRKNGSNVAGMINGAPSQFISTPIPTTIISVTSGDEIEIVFEGNDAKLRSGSINTWLCVEVIE